VKLKEIINALQLEELSGPAPEDKEVTGAYIADLLSCVMAGARAGHLWFTLQTHLNIVAVASLAEVAAVVVTENAPVPEETVARAKAQGVVLLRSAEPTFEAVSRLIQAGFPDV